MGGISSLRAALGKDSPTTSDVHVDSLMNDRRRTLKKKRMLMDAALAKAGLIKGDYPGHPFRGNQWTGGRGTGISRSRPKIDAMAAPKAKTMKQMEAEVAALTPAQAKRYWSTPSHYTHEQGMKFALSGGKKPATKKPAAKQTTAPVKPNTKAKPPKDADGDTPPQAKNPDGTLKYDKKTGEPVWLKPTPNLQPDPGKKDGDPKRFTATDGDAAAFGMRRPTEYERKYGIEDDSGNRFRIPPAWRDVWVSNSPAGATGGLLASGIDVAGRAQPKYTTATRAANNTAHFKEIARLQTEIDGMQKKWVADAAAGDQRALGLLLMRTTGIRSGSTEKGTTGKASFGATTLLASHVTPYGKGVRIQFTGKGQKKFDVKVTEPDVLVKGLLKLKADSKGKHGAKLFDQKVANYEKTADYLKKTDPQGSFTPHNLRSLKATEVAMSVIASMKAPTTKAELETARKQVGKEVGAVINDTVKITLGHYIHPVVFAQWEAGISE